MREFAHFAVFDDLVSKAALERAGYGFHVYVDDVDAVTSSTLWQYHYRPDPALWGSLEPYSPGILGVKARDWREFLFRVPGELERILGSLELERILQS